MPRSSILVFLVLGFFGTACGELKALPPPESRFAQLPEMPVVTDSTLQNSHVERMMVLFFKDGLARERWSKIFKSAFKLSDLQRARDRAVAANADEESLEKLDDSTSDILSGELLESVGYFLMWNSNRFDCDLLGPSETQNTLNMKCKGDERPEVSLPHAPTLSGWRAQPANPQGKLFVPYVGVNGTYQGIYGKYEIQMQLRPEARDPMAPQNLLLKGDVILSPRSEILDSPFGEKMNLFKYGYAEVLLKTPALPK